MPGYKMTATIINKGTTKSPEPAINLAGLGLRKGAEILDHTSPDGTSTEDLRNQFRGIDKKSRGQKMPMTMLWLPPSERPAFLKNQKGKVLKVRVFIAEYEGNANWTLEFDDAEVMDPKDEKRKLANGQFAPYTLQRVDLTFKKFIDDPSYK